MARGQVRDECRIEQLANAFPRYRSVVADQRETALLLPDDLVKQTLRRSDTHEAADHDARAGRDHRNGFFDGKSPMIETPVDKSINERADVAAMLTRAVGTPLICVKAFRYSVRE